MRSPRARSRSFQYQLSRFHQRLILSVYRSNAVVGSTRTSIDWLTPGAVSI